VKAMTSYTIKKQKGLPKICRTNFCC